MKLKLIEMYNGQPAGTILNVGGGVGQLLLKRKMAEEVTEVKDPDEDGKAEGGIRGEKKAFSRPPVGKSGRR